MQTRHVPQKPSVIVIAGPNGSGKSTSASSLLAGIADLEAFVNADEIAKGLAGFAPERAAVAAGRVMLDRLKELSSREVTFAFETTLASRAFAPWIADLLANGYDFHLIFLTLPSPDLSVARVAGRVHEGGHDIPEAVIRRRFEGSHRNFFVLYRPMATTWKMYDNASQNLALVAAGSASGTDVIADAPRWQALKRSYGT